MRVLILVVSALALSLGIIAAPVFGQSCPAGQRWNDCSGPQFGPGGCIPGCVGTALPTDGPFGPSELCIQDSCSPVTYTWFGNLVVAESTLPNGYEVMGWSGPCLETARAQCPDILNQAFSDLRMNALRANRAQRYE